MKKRKFAAPLLTLGLAAGLVMPIQAADGDKTPDITSEGIELSKSATLTSEGTYTIELEAYATGTVHTDKVTDTKGVPCDIVLVLDQSGSMKNQLSAKKEYIKNTKIGLSYDDLSQTYYVKYGDIYYQVERENDGSKRNPRCYLYITVNGKNLYLNGEEFTESKYIVNSRDTDIWYGDNYVSQAPTKALALKSAVNGFIDNVKNDSITNNVDHKISVVGFASGTKNEMSGYDASAYENTELLSTSSPRQYPIQINDYYRESLVNANDGGRINSRLTSAIDAYATNGATHANYGLIMAKGIFDSRTETTFEGFDGEIKERKKIVIFFTDGYPGNQLNSSCFADSYGGENLQNITTANETIKAAKELKESGATVYSVGMVAGADPKADYKFDISGSGDTKQYTDGTKALNAYLHFVSSDYKSAKTMEGSRGVKADANGYYIAANDAQGLNGIFEKLSDVTTSSSSSSSTDLNASAVLKDIMADGFVMTKDSNVSVETFEYKGKEKEKMKWSPCSTPGIKVEKSEDNKTVSVTGFDYSTNYVVDESEDGQVVNSGKKLKVTITGVIPEDSAITGEKILTNSDKSGVYEDPSKKDPVAKFPHPDTILTKKAVVIDYAKAKSTDLVDTRLETVGHISSDLGSFTGTGRGAYGSIVAENNNTKLSYSPEKMNWNGYDSFYVFGTSNDEMVRSCSANANGNLWSKVSFIPANNVYYEDDFITKSDGTQIGIEYSQGDWKLDDNDVPDVEKQDGNAENHGWIDELKTNNGFTAGSAHYATVEKGQDAASAKFEFTGTGFDIYSKTNNLTGKVMVLVFRSSDLAKEEADKNNPEKKPEDKFRAGAIAAKTVNTYAKNGSYYHIPAVHFDLDDHDTYTVNLTVMSSGSDDSNPETKNRRATYYIDGIRVYNPIKNLEGKQIVKDAYGNEIKATFTNLRNELIETGYKNYTGDGNVFYIDKLDGDSHLADYEVVGPSHEIYLNPGKKIGFKVADTEAEYQIGLKTPKGVADVTLSDGGPATRSFAINSATDMYYSIKPDNEGYIFIENTDKSGDSILSITHLKRTKSEAAEMLLTPDPEVIVQRAMAFESLPTLDYDEPVENAPEESEPVMPDLDVDDEDTEDKDPSLGDILKSLFGGFVKLFPPFN